MTSVNVLTLLTPETMREPAVYTVATLFWTVRSYSPGTDVGDVEGTKETGVVCFVRSRIGATAGDAATPRRSNDIPPMTASGSKTVSTWSAPAPTIRFLRPVT